MTRMRLNASKLFRRGDGARQEIPAKEKITLAELPAWMTATTMLRALPYGVPSEQQNGVHPATEADEPQVNHGN